MRFNPLAGSVPFVAVAILCAGAFFAGHLSVVPRDKVAVAEKGAVVLQAMLEHPDATPDQVRMSIAQPIRDVLGKYAARGYTVIDVSRDERGFMEVAATPAGALDITAELRAAVKLPQSPLPASAVAGAAVPASGAGDHHGR